jgi:ribosomal protein S2
VAEEEEEEKENGEGKEEEEEVVNWRDRLQKMMDEIKKVQELPKVII